MLVMFLGEDWEIQCCSWQVIIEDEIWTVTWRLLVQWRLYDVFIPRLGCASLQTGFSFLIPFHETKNQVLITRKLLVLLG
jgi:hypothetical protein